MTRIRLIKSSHLVLVLIACAAVVVCYEFLIPTPKNEDSIHARKPGRKASESSYVAQEETVANDQTGSTAKLEAHVVEQYTQGIEQPIFKAIQDFEFRARRLISDRKFGESQFITLEIPAFDSNQIAHLHGLIARGVENLPKEARQRATEMALKYVAKYTSYPAQYKFIQIVAPEDPTKKSQLFELYTDNHKSGMPNADGVLVMDLASGKSIHHDQKFGDLKSWGTQRYGHLIEVTALNGAKNETPSR